MSYITPALTRSSSRQEGYEVRLTGLNQVVTAKELKEFFSAAIRVIDVHLHPSLPGQDGLIKQWAQVWTCSDEEVDKCLTLKESLASKGITISRAPVAPMSPWNASQPPLPTTFALPPTPPSFDHLHRPDMAYRDQEYRTGSRNLYVLGVPIDLTQTQFKALFVPFGMVQHSTLLSQLDNMGRRRGFVLMSNHEEAARALVAMNGKVIDGSRIDVSWALIQRESRHFSGSGIGAMPNRVIHPPTLPLRREPTIEASVMVDNLDPNVFSTPGVIQEVFSHFGPILRVTTIPGTLQAIIAFENILSAERLIGSDGMMMGGRIINTRPLIPTTGVDTFSSPPPLSLPSASTMPKFTSLPTQGAHQINVSQPPFDPFSSDTLFRQAKSTPIRITSSSPVTSSSPTRDTNPSSDPPAHETYSSDTGTSRTETSTASREKWSW